MAIICAMNMMSELQPEGIEVLVPHRPQFEEILTPEALRFVAGLERQFRDRRNGLLTARRMRQRRFDAGELPDFLPETAHIREASWRVAPLPADLQDRRVEIVGPVDKKSVVHALNSGANCYMADFEDAYSPTWNAIVNGQLHIRDAVNRTLEYVVPEKGQRHRLPNHIPTLMIRPRGWHLTEKHVLVDGREVSASLFDFGLFLFHNAHKLIEQGSGPYLYLPKLESHLEARLWNDAFLTAQRELDLPPGTIRATVLIETVPAAFEMDEILYELRDHAAGLSCGRWDYVFSWIKCFRNRPEMTLPDRAQLTMATGFLRSFSLLAIKTCHRRGASAIGGLAAQVPVRDDRAASAVAVAAVRADKRREATDGHDGTWVAHPEYVPVARREFDAVLHMPNQIVRQRDDVLISPADLLAVPTGSITEDGLRRNIRVGIQYLESWLSGRGCVPLDHTFEDAATAEISRAQVWQWLRHRSRLDDGRVLTLELFDECFDSELRRIETYVGRARFESGNFSLAGRLFREIILEASFTDFLTLKAYPYLP